MTETVARYLTVGTATVDVTDTGTRSLMDGRVLARTVSAACRGCGSQLGKTDRDWFSDQAEPDDVFEGALRKLREGAQEHAEKCRAMPTD